MSGNRGLCGASAQLEVSAFHPHFGEEVPLVGSGGSGTIFFTHCSLRCAFCQNWQISQGGEGSVARLDVLAEMMLRLQRMGCHNVNVVTPTHYLPHILLALDIAAAGGLRLPIVYNSSGWERGEILDVLEGIVDIYLPDVKYADPAMAARYSSGAESYPETVREALLEMNRQVGVARPDSEGLVRRGLMIRHLVMPNGVSGTKNTLAWISANLPKDTYVNLMAQYRPQFQAHLHPAIARPVTQKEYADAVRWAREVGLTNLDIQGSMS